MGIFILEKGASPYWDGGQDAPDCRSGLGRYEFANSTRSSSGTSSRMSPSAVSRSCVDSSR